MYISDSEIYRYLPAVLVGTVDRLARAGQTDLFSSIFSGPVNECPSHGFTPFDSCIESKRCSDSIEPTVPQRWPSPGLLIQDEIHLLRESLGTYDSHYEGLVDVLSREVGSGFPPKRLAATATIEGLEPHIYHLYVGKGRAFPVKGPASYESAYVEPDPDRPVARLYVGVLPSGRDADDVSRVLLTELCRSARVRAENGSDDPYYDLVLGYVNEKNTASDLRAE